MRSMTTVILLLALTACGAGTPPAEEPQEPDEAGPAPAEAATPAEPESTGGGGTADDVAATAPAATDSAPPPLEPEELTSAVIQRVVRGRLADFQMCYESRLVLSPRLAGRVTVELVVGADGTVIESSVQSSTIDDSEVDDCVVGVGRSLQFPPPIGNEDVVVHYPFVFGSG